MPSMNEMSEIMFQDLDEILAGELTKSTFLFQFDSIVILQNKRDKISQEQIKITKKMTSMFLV